MSKAKRIENLQEWKKEDKTDSNPWMKRAKESFRFYTAIKQWNQEDIDKLDAEGRPHLTIPLITSIVNAVVGYQIDNEQQFNLYPRRGGSVSVANLGTEILKHVTDNCNAQDHYTESFQDGNVGGVGVLEIKDRNDFINKELLVRKRSPFRIIFDQSAIEYDFDERGRRVFEEMWLTKEEIEENFGKSVKDIQESVENPKFEDEVTFIEDDDYEENQTDREFNKGLYRVTKAYWRKWKKRVYLVYLKDFSKKLLTNPRVIEMAKNAMEIHNSQAADLGQPPVFKIVERAGWQLYKTWFVGEMELFHQEDPWGDISDFPIKPFYPYWADGYPFGIIDGNKDAQRYLNKMFSKEIEPNVGWEVDDSSDDVAMEDLKRHGGKSNFIFRKDKFKNGKRLDPPKTFFDTDVAVARLERFMNLISGQDPTLRGFQKGSGKESGKALDTRIESGVRVSKIVHKNFNRTLRSVGSFLWKAIRQKDEEGNPKYYSNEEIEAIVQEKKLKPFMMMGPTGPKVNLDPFHQTVMGDYGIKLVTSPSSRTIREENLEYLIRIADVYANLFGFPVIPPHILLNYLDIAEKDEIDEYLKMLQSQPQAPVVRNSNQRKVKSA